MVRAEPELTELATQRARAEKYQQLSAVLEGCFDLLNEETTGPEWLAKVAAMAECETAAIIWWREGKPDNYLVDVHGELQYLVEDWIDLMEPAFTESPSPEPVMLDDVITDSAMLGPQRMVYCLETTPTRYVLIFERPTARQAFTEQDRQATMRVMQILAKPIKLKRRLSWLGDVVELCNKTFDEIPFGFVTFFPSGRFVKANRLGRSLIESSTYMRVRDGRFELTDAPKQEAMQEQILRLLSLPQSSLREFVWHRNLSDTTGPDSCLAAMLSFPVDNWKLESTENDRIVVLVLQVESERALPNVAQIREFYQVTKAQARLIRSMMEGRGVEAAADNLNVSVNTVRSHLRAIYNKLGVENKAEMLKRVSKTITGYRADQK